MGKGDIRTRRGKVWRGTYGVTRPRRWKTVIKPVTKTRKVKELKDIPKAVEVEQIKKVVAEAVHSNVAETTESVATETAAEKAPAKKPRKPSVKKAAAKKTEE